MGTQGTQPHVCLASMCSSTRACAASNNSTVECRVICNQLPALVMQALTAGGGPSRAFHKSRNPPQPVEPFWHEATWLTEAQFASNSGELTRQSMVSPPASANHPHRQHSNEPCPQRLFLKLWHVKSGSNCYNSLSATA